MFAFSMSKGYTLYGQRAGALIGVSSSKDVIDEFADLGKYSARTAWSNVNRAAMTLLTEIRGDQSLKARLDAERLAFADKLHRRGAVFVEEARSCGLQHVPYQAGSSFPSRRLIRRHYAKRSKRTSSLPYLWLKAFALGFAPLLKAR